MTWMRKLATALALMLALLALGACGSSDGSASDGEAKGLNADNGDDSGGDSGSDDDTVKFGEDYAYDDGLTVRVTVDGPFKPSVTASGGEGFDDHVMFTVKIVNETGSTYDASGAFASLQSGNEEGEEVFDTKLVGAPMTKVLDGRETTYKIGFGVKDPKDLVMDYTPDFERESVLFTG